MKVLLFACLLLAALQYGQSSSIPNHVATESEHTELKLSPVSCAVAVVSQAIASIPDSVSICLDAAKDSPGMVLALPLCAAIGVVERVAFVVMFAKECQL